MFIKIGELIEVSRIEDAGSCTPLVSQEILDNFKKFAANLKKIAPKAEDFLYFSAVMMHAAEASALNEDGTIKLNVTGDQVKVGWDKSDNTWRWQSNDPSIKPYKNSNGDIFPEEELVKAYKKWVGKPLCIDHKSSSVDHVRGFIVDTYYDRNLKRVIALCALDKHNYPDLARKVATGYSNNVSMGTAVGRAICSDCGRVARTESDFCSHMKGRTCYGEINIDLNPIELSIVVNGADPKAHIKHIIAAANTLNSYVETKERELNKLAGGFSATIRNDDHCIDIKAESIEDFKKSFEEACTNFKDLVEDANNAAFNQSSGTVVMDETVTPNTDSGLAPPHERYATSNVDVELISELKIVTASIESKLNQMKQSLNKLSNTSTNIQEENMSGSREINKQGYFQGAGDENEPTPNQPKYQKDPTNEKLRTDGDKHMEADDVGPVDGMHPGPSSVGMSELERKKMLARAQAEENTMRRNAIVDMAKKALEQKKLAYFQQGEKNPQEPTPGKTKYQPEKLNSDLREDADKQMVGQKPFPGVGPVDGMHPSPASADTSDEKKRKELLQRASLKARFVKASNNDGTQDLGKSAWEVFLGDRLLLTASVNELSGNRPDFLYDSIATKEFGSKLIEKVKVQGADKVRAIVKSAAPTGELTPEAPPAPAAPEAPAPAAPETTEDTGKSGDKKKECLELAEKARDTNSDLVESIRALIGEQQEMGTDEAPEALPEMGASASDKFSTSTLNTLRKEINVALVGAMKEAVAELNEHEQELQMIANMYDNGSVNNSNNEFVGSIVDDAIEESKNAIADGFKLMTAFVKYARGTKAIVKRAEIEAELEALASEGEPMNASDSQEADDLANLINETNDDIASVEEMFSEEDNTSGSEEGIEGLLEELEGENLADDNDIQVNVPAGAPIPTGLKPEDEVNVMKADDELIQTASGRSELRAKLAAEALKTSPHLHEAHPKGSFTTDLDVKPTGNLAEVEDLEDEHDAVLDLANAPPKVRKEAEAIHKLISEGKLDPADLDALISEGLDKDAVSYYKKYFSQVDGGSEFASELVKEHVKAQMEEELNGYRVKLARAYELAYDMVDRGLCHNDRNSVSAQVDEIMKFNDESFDSLKRVVAKNASLLRKEAGHMPQVGMIGSNENNSTITSEENLVAQLESALSKTTKKMF